METILSTKQTYRDCDLESFETLPMGTFFSWVLNTTNGQSVYTSCPFVKTSKKQAFSLLHRKTERMDFDRQCMIIKDINICSTTF